MEAATFAAHGAVLRHVVALATQPGMDWEAFAAACERNAPGSSGRPLADKRADVARKLATDAAVSFSTFVADLRAAREAAGDGW